MTVKISPSSDLYLDQTKSPQISKATHAKKSLVGTKTTTTNVTRPTASNWRACLVMVFTLLSVTSLTTGCNRIEKTAETIEIKDNLGTIYINPDEVIISDAHITGMKFERFQPSLTLYGSLVPTTETIVLAPEPLKVADILVANNQLVDKDTPIVSYLPYSPEMRNPDFFHPIDAGTTTVSNTDNQTDKNQQMRASNQSQVNQEAPSSTSISENNLNSNTGKQPTNKQPTNATKNKENPPKGNESTLSHKNMKTDKNNNSASASNPLIDSVINPAIDSVANTKEQEQINPKQLNQKRLDQKRLSIKTREQNLNIALNTSENIIARLPKPSTLLAPIAGKIELINSSSFSDKIVEKNQPIASIYSPDDFHFVSRLPLAVKGKLSIGNIVKFVVTKDDVNNNHDNHNLTTIDIVGQISNINNTLDGDINIEVHITKELTSPETMKLMGKGLRAQGKVDYGQIEVGTLIPKSGVHDLSGSNQFSALSTNLSAFTSPTAHVVAPVKAYVWIVGHDLILKRHIVDVISYNKSTNQYLVAGVPKYALICLVDLPSSEENKKLRVI